MKFASAPLVLAALFGTLAQAPSALACGGFFCSAASPVNQTAEQIIFSQNDDGTITQVIQIAYRGPSESFAWVLPVRGVPTVGVSSNSALQTLMSATEPQYQLETTTVGDCKEPDFRGSGGAGQVVTDSPTNSPNGPVTVLVEGSVGPYDYVAIEPMPGLDDPARVALDWLADNDYDVTSIAPDVLGPYLAEGLNLLAFRLTKGNQVGSIRPVMITYPGDKPSIPIRPTAVAANEDMGVLVWVLGSSRAIPENYLGLELNEARIDWFNWRSNYDSVVSEAADEAGGHGFVTEFAGSTEEFGDTIWTTFHDQQWEQFNAETYPTPFDRMSAAASLFRGWDGVRDAIGDATTLPPGVTLDQFGQDPDSYRDDPALVIDEELFQQRLLEWVIEPVQKTQALIDGSPSMTRLYTTLSPIEMTEDPLFSFNPDLPDVSRVHTAQATIHCSEDVSPWEAPYTIRLENGLEINGTQQAGWPIDSTMAPAAARILTLSQAGLGEVVMDNSSDIAGALSDAPVAPGSDAPAVPGSDAPAVPGSDAPVATESDAPVAPEVDPPNNSGVEESSSADAGCSVKDPSRHGPLMGAAWLALCLSWAFAARRRRA